MILNVVLGLLMSFNISQNSYNGFYAYGGWLADTENLPTLQVPSDSDSSYIIDSFIQTTCSVSYDDDGAYYLSDFNFYIVAKAYWYDVNLNQQQLDRTIFYNYSPNWEITNNEYQQQLADTSFKIGLNASTDSIYIEVYFDSSLIDTVTDELDDSWDNRSSSYINVTLNQANFFTYLDNYLSLVNGQYVDTQAIYQNGYANGYTEGFNAGSQVDTTAVTIFNGILNIALVPINFFLAIFNFEILGINVSSLVSALLSICLIIIVVRFVTGKKQGGE